MRFFVSEIKGAGVVEREESVSANDLIGTPPAFVSFRQPVKSKVTARMTTDGEIVLVGHVTTVVTYQCGRCLDFFDRSIDLEFQDVVQPDQPEIEVNGEIRETLLIDLPVRSVCRDNCRGICASCGKNLNAGSCACAATQADPRWDALKKFPFK